MAGGAEEFGVEACGPMDENGCDGTVFTLQGLDVVVTGKVFLREGHVVRPVCEERISAAGATVRSDFSNKVDLIVQGNLEGQRVVDPERGHSRKIAAALERTQRGGRHTHVVDHRGIQHLLSGQKARCRRISVTDGDVHLTPELAPRPPDVPLHPHATPAHDAEGLLLDLTGLDKGTAAHEETIELLIVHLHISGITAVQPRADEPRFDAAWHHRDEMFIAEVKSLTGAREDQQIRLGLGQVLDYAYQMPTRVHAVLVLEKEPADARWSGLAGSLGVILTWSPFFPSLQV